MESLSDGRYRIIKAGEKNFFPLENNFLKSLFFFILVYTAHLFHATVYAESFFLPFARLRLSVFLPPCVFMRFLNPCTLLLCLFLG